MSSPTTRAEARRRAILARGGDRLAKLTTSARGEDAPAYMPDTVQPPRSGAEFVGEDSGLQRPSPSPSPSPLAHPDPSVWSQEQQHQFMQALMGSGVLNPASGPSQSLPPPFLPPPTTGEDPLATMMAELSKMGMGAVPGAGVGVGGAAGKVPEPPKPPAPLRKWMPLLHLVCMWTLLAVFVLWKEPQAFVEKTAGAVEVAFWKRWPKLATQGTSLGTWGVQVVPFFWAFMTLQVMLHSLRIFIGHNEVKPPALLSVALQHIPSPFPSLIMNTLRYFRMGSAVMDDVAAIVFGIGIIILISSWFVD